MGERTSYTPGTFSWADLSTTDDAGAQQFYSALLGWSFEDVPAGDSAIYTMCRIDGREVAALFRQTEQERSQGVPPHWNSYITVAHVDEVAAQVEGLGGSLLMPPFDVMTVGRMAVAADPTGAVFAMWEPRDSIGATLVNVPGALCWNDLGTPDVGATKQFYGDLFGWTAETAPGAPMEYAMFHNGGRENGSVHKLGQQEQGVPPHWLVYFATDDLEGATGRVDGLGGQVMVGPLDVPAGRLAVIADPQGAAFGLFAGELDP